MNWLKSLLKTSSVTFSLQDSDKISQPKTVYNLSTDLYYWAVKNVPKKYFNNKRVMIDVDGLDVDTYTGTINWYITDPELSYDIPKYINQWIQEISLLDIEAQIGELEQSNMYPDDLVWRINIIKNLTIEFEKIPELNLTNDNAKALFGALNMPAQFEGIIDLKIFEQRLKNVNPNRIKEFTREDDFAPNVFELNNQNFTQNENPFFGENKHTGFSLSEADIKNYINRLINIVDFGLKNGFKYFTLS